MSQWETGQTLPTLENLERLRDIFGISLDELALRTVELPAQPPEPFPEWVYKPEKRDIQQTTWELWRPWLLSFSLFLVLSVYGAFLARWNLQLCIPLGMVNLAFIVMSVIQHSSSLRKALADLERKALRYRLEGDALRVTVLKDNDCIHEQLIRKADRRQHFRSRRYVLFSYRGTAYFLPKIWLEESEALALFFRPEEQKRLKATKGQRLAAVMLNVFSAASPIFAALVSALVRPSTANTLGWIFLPFTVIPIGSMVFYAVLRKKGLVFLNKSDPGRDHGLSPSCFRSGLRTSVLTTLEMRDSD